MTENERIQALADFRESEMVFLSLLNAPGAFDKSISRNVSVYKIQRGDRIERIAARFGVSVNEIVELNKLEYPFVDTELKKTVKNVAGTGDELMIPASIGMDSTTLVQEDIEDKKYGTDFLFDFDSGDLIMNDSDTDVVMTRGIPMIVQQIKIMLSTKAGRLLDFPSYGNPLRIGRVQNAWRISLDKINLVNALKTDARINSAHVERVSGSGSGDVEYTWRVQIGNIEQSGSVGQL